MYAVTGITGRVGGGGARALLDAGLPVRAVVRDDAKGGAWERRGCEVAFCRHSDARALERRPYRRERRICADLWPAKALIQLREMSNVRRNRCARGLRASNCSLARGPLVIFVLADALLTKAGFTGCSGKSRSRASL